MIIFVDLICICVFMLTGCSTQDKAVDKNAIKSTTPSKQVQIENEKDEIHKHEESGDMLPMKLTVNNQTYTAHFFDNDTVRAFLKQMPLTITMDELHGNEKFYYFSTALPTSSQYVSQIHSGDIKLFGSDCLVLFYKDFTTSYSYSNLGYIDDPKALADAVGNGSARVTFEQIE